MNLTVSAANAAPTISISQPDGVSDSVAVGAAFNITYTLADSDSAATASFYYDIDNTGLNGTAITGCSNLAEGTNATCSWDTTGMTAGNYYVYAVATDGVNPNVNAYSAGTLTITAAAPVNVTYYVTPGTATAVGADGSTNYTIDLPATAPGVRCMLGSATANTAFSYRPTSGMVSGTWVTLLKTYSPVYATAKTITAGSAAGFSIRGYNTADNWRCNIYAYNPAGAAGNKTLVLTSSVVNSGTGATVTIAPTYTGSGTIPAGYQLMMELDYQPGGATYTPRVYNTTSTFTVTQQ